MSLSSQHLTSLRELAKSAIASVNGGDETIVVCIGGGEFTEAEHAHRIGPVLEVFFA